jgi:hypothetical protein
MRGRLATAVTLLAVLFAACGGGGDGGKTASSTSTTEAGATTTTPAAAGSTVAGKSTTTRPASPAAQESIKNLAFVASDFPAGWTGAAPSGDTTADDEELSKCAGASGPDANVASLDSQEFSKEGDQVSSEAVVVRDAATYSKDLAAIRSDKFSSCLEEFLKKEVEKDAPPGSSTTVDVTRLDVPSHGDFSDGRRVTLTLKGNGQTLTLYADVVAYGKKRIEVSAVFLGFGHPVDAALRSSLLGKLGGRIDAATPPA